MLPPAASETKNLAVELEPNEKKRALCYPRDRARDARIEHTYLGQYVTKFSEAAANRAAHVHPVTQGDFSISHSDHYMQCIIHLLVGADELSMPRVVQPPSNT